MKRKIAKELVGRTVIVHPYLTTDPMHRPGQVGKIIEISPVNEEVATIEFSDGKKAAYLTDGLLTLYPRPLLLQGLQSNRLTNANRELILSVIKHIRSDKLEDALKLAMTNDTTRFFCTTTCADWLDMKEEQKRNRGNGLKK